MAKFQVVGISGKAGSGKDFIAQHFFLPNGYTQFSFAWHMKVWVVGKGEATHDEVFLTKPPHIRKLLQEEGTERGRNVYGEQVWVRTMFEWMNVLSEFCGITKFVVPDVRFPNEAKAIQDVGGKVIRVAAPKRVVKSGLTSEQRQHISETALDTWNGFDGFVYNDPENAETVSRQLDMILGENFTQVDEDEDDDWNFWDTILGWI